MVRQFKSIIYSWFNKERKVPVKIDLSKLDLIKMNKSKLLDLDFLENNLILNLGLNNEILHEFPTHLYPYCGQGLYVWQYPNQLSIYLKFISQFKIQSYLEIGVRHGGMFLLTKTYLETINSNKVYCLGVDIEKNKILKKNAKSIGYDYYVKSSSSHYFKRKIKDISFDLALIDGDHSFEACLNDFELIKDKTNIIVFHDVISDVCPGVVKIWETVKKDIRFQTFEMINQYEEVTIREGRKYLGIGVAVKKEFIN